MSTAGPQPTSSTVLPPGTCLIHGPHAGYVCPTCCTAVRIVIPNPNVTVRA